MQQKEGGPILHKSSDGTGEHYAECSKLAGERQIPYDLTFDWNIINKKKKANKIYAESLKLRTI